MRKHTKSLIIGAGLILVGVVGGFLIGNDNSEDQQTAGDTEQETPESTQQEEPPPVPPHQDNEEDLSEDVITTTRDIANEFIKQYATLNPEQPNAYLEQIKPLVTNELYQALSNGTRRGTALVQKRQVINLETYPVDDVVPGHKHWNVIAIVEEYDENGDSQKKQISYWVGLEKTSAGEWKVSGFEVGQ